MRFGSTRAAAIATIAASLSIATLAQQAPVPQQPPTLRSRVTIVPIDVRVIDGRGKPLTDLRQEEFTVFEDGVRQPIGVFSTQAYVADETAKVSELALRGRAEADAAPRNRRVFLFVLGRGRHQVASKYVDALMTFLDRQTLPQDQIALQAWNRATDFTTDHALLKRTVLRFRDRHAAIETELLEWFSGLRAIYGSKEIPPHIQKQIDAVFEEAASLRARPLAPAPVADKERIDREAREVTQNLQRNREIQDRLAAGMSTLPDMAAANAASLTDLEFDEYMAKMTETMQDVGSLYAGVGYLRVLEGEKHLVMLTANGFQLPSMDSEVSIARAASDARVALDVIQTGGMIGPPPPRFVAGRGIVMTAVPTTNQMFDQSFRMQTLRMLADFTGGQFHAYQTGETAFRSLAETTTFSYVIGYSPTNPALNGKYRKIEVKVSRPGAKVMYRQGYYATDRLVPLDRREFITELRVSAAAATDQLVDHIKLKLGRPLVSQTAAAQQVEVELHVDLARVKFAVEDDRRAASIDVAVYAGDVKGQPIGELRRRVDLRFPAEQFEQRIKTGLTINLIVPVKGDVRALKAIVYDFGADLVGSASARIDR